MSVAANHQLEHRGIGCVHCERPSIRGARYKCICCPNVNVCEQCHAVTFAVGRRIGSTNCLGHLAVRLDRPVTQVQQQRCRLVADRSTLVHEGYHCTSCVLQQQLRQQRRRSATAAPLPKPTATAKPKPKQPKTTKAASNATSKTTKSEGEESKDEGPLLSVAPEPKAPPIIGRRFHCIQCGIDLCDACEFSGCHHPEHPRIVFTTPMPAKKHPSQQQQQQQGDDALVALGLFEEVVVESAATEERNSSSSGDPTEGATSALLNSTLNASRTLSHDTLAAAAAAPAKKNAARRSRSKKKKEKERVFVSERKGKDIAQVFVADSQEGGGGGGGSGTKY